jgi:hypothetical protein
MTLYVPPLMRVGTTQKICNVASEWVQVHCLRATSRASMLGGEKGMPEDAVVKRQLNPMSEDGAHAPDLIIRVERITGRRGQGRSDTGRGRQDGNK